MTKQKFKIINWLTYNKALKERGSLTVWMDESSIMLGRRKPLLKGVDGPLHYSDMAITTALMMKRVIGLSLRALQGFVDSIFKLMSLMLKCPDYSLLSKRAKTVNISIKTSTRGKITHLVIYSTGLKVLSEGEMESPAAWCRQTLEYGVSCICQWIVRHIMKLSVSTYRTAVPLTHGLCRS